MSDPTPQSSEPGTVRLVTTDAGVRFEDIAKKPPEGQAYVQTDRAKSKRDQEIEAGRQRVAYAAEQLKARPPRVISEKERMAQGGSVPVFRPSMASLDRQNTGLGPLMRRVGSKAAPVEAVAPVPTTS